MSVDTDPIERLTQTWEPKLREAFLDVIRGIRDQTRLDRLVELIRAGDVDGVLLELGLEAARFRAFESVIFAAFETGGMDITVRIDRYRRANRTRPLFDVRKPSADAWITDHATSLIRDITEDQRRLVRQALEPLSSGLDPIMTGETPQKIAIDLVGRVNRTTGRREGGLIGLSSGHAEWVRNYEAELRGERPIGGALERALRDRRFDKTIMRAMETGQPVPEKTIRAAVSNYRNRALRHRAENIAANEAQTVLNRSQLEAWDQAVERGVITYDRVRRFWVDREDSHVRPWHAEIKHMNPKGVGLREPFKTPRGPAMNPGWDFEPGCRCRVLVRPIED